MKLNHRSVRPRAYLDFETQSRSPLSTTHKYATHESTKVLTCVVKTSDGVVHRMGPYLTAEHKEMLTRIASSHILVAHNAVFDAAIWEHAAGLPEAEWFDTLPCARAAGLPGKLDELGKKLTGEGKDKNGKRLVDMLCIIGNGPIPAVGPAHALLMEYNIRDVELLEQIDASVRDFGEPDVIAVDRIVNDRGVPVDREMLLKMRDLYKVNEALLSKQFDEAAGGVNPKSPKQVTTWLASMGFKVDGISKSVMKDLLADPERFFEGDQGDFDANFDVVVEALNARREVVRVGSGKIEAALEALEDDGRLREQFVYYGAGPGRWAGRTLQLHNMPLVPKYASMAGVEPTYESMKAAAEKATADMQKAEKTLGKIGVADMLNAFIRHCIRGQMCVADYASVEARMLAHMARCSKQLTIFEDPKKSVYLDMGQHVYKRAISKDDKVEYALAKALVLGCGYGMSGSKFEWLYKQRNASIEQLKNMGMTAAETVKVYRSTYAEIPALWTEVGKAVKLAVEGIPMEAGRCKFYMVKGNLHLELPSGRPIVYRNARIEMLVPGYVKMYNMPETPVPTVVYDHPTRAYSVGLWGSKVVENMCQGACRDFVADKLIQFEAEGMKPFLHVHDEIACETDRFERFLNIMSEPPSWAPDFPLLVEGYVGDVWTKTPKALKFAEAHAMRGVML